MSYAPRTSVAAGLRGVAERQFKAYELAAPGKTIDDGLRAAAWQQLPKLSARPVEQTTPSAGWCVLPYGEDGVYVIANS